MNSVPTWVALVAAILSPLVTFLSIAYYSGQTRERLDNHGLQLSAHGQRLDAHNDDITSSKERLARLEGWKEGFKAGRGDKEGQ